MRRLAFIGLLIFLTACNNTTGNTDGSSATSAPLAATTTTSLTMTMLASNITPTQTPIPATATPRLPPTWTFTPHPEPSPTPTLTATPTATPTQSASDICKDFGLAAAPSQNAVFEFDGIATFAWHTVPADIPMSLSITLHGSISGVRADNIPGGDGLVNIAMMNLPTPGQYDWKIWLNHPAFGAICPYSGTFVRLPFKII